MVAVGADLATPDVATVATASAVAEPSPKPPLRGALVVGADDEAALIARLRGVHAAAVAGTAPEPAPPHEADLRAAERVAIDYADASDLADKAEQAVAAFDQPIRWKVLRGRGIYRGSGPAAKVAFLYTGQGSQYANMLATLRDVEPVVAQTFDEADAVMTPLIGRPLTSYLFADPTDAEAVAAAEAELRKTEITQPAVLSVDLALTRLLAAYGIVPDLVMGHSLGEYGALVAAGALTFPAALEAVSARGREMADLSMDDNGAMAAVFAPLEEIEKIVAEADGYVVIANVNSTSQAVIGGATAAVSAAVEQCQRAGLQTAMLPVSHAFHTSIVAPASEPLRRTLERLELRSPQIPIISNVTGELYPMGPGVVPEMLDLLAAQVASPVQFVKGLRTLYDAGARVFVEVGPKKALQGFASDVLGDGVVALATNHPKLGDTPALNQALCGLYAAGLGVGLVEQAPDAARVVETTLAAPPAERVEDREEVVEPAVITGAALGLPGAPHLFDDSNVARILHGEQGIDVIPTGIRHEMLDRHITRLVKDESGGRFETIDSPADVIKLAARAGEFDLGAEFGVDADRIPALGRETQLAIGAGIDALRDAGIPLVQHYRTTSVGTHLPDRWMLPDELRDRTGIIFASAFPGYNDLAEELTRFGIDSARRHELATLEAVRAKVAQADGHPTALAEIDRRIHDLQLVVEQDGYTFDRRFLFRVLSMGHSQFAELIGARGPNTQVNAACASTTQAVSLAEDWIRAGRCERVVIVAADDVTSNHLLCWMGSGFLASGAAATDENVEEAAVPFDRRRHGMILGMGAAAIVVESASAARERGIRPICEVLGTVTANSAFHGTRLDVDHIGTVMESLVTQAEARGERREEMAPAMVFISHETYTPARGGSAAAEVNALRRVFGAAADQVVVANTKGYTGHPMGVGIEDVVAVKALETGIVPPVPNFKEPDPDLGPLNLSIGGVYPVRYALRLAAGFGSQISMLLLRWVPTPDGQRPNLDALGYAGRIADPAAWREWLARAGADQNAQLEVDHRTLRVAARDAVRTTPAPEPESAPTPDVAPAAPVALPAEVAAVAMPATVAAVPAPEPVTGMVPPAAPPAPPAEEVAARVVALVAEQTGYPPELLDLDLDLEADLGIDTVKQAELFAQVRETYGIARDDTLKLRDYPTLNHVIAFVRDRTPQPAEPSTEAIVEEPPAADATAIEPPTEDDGFPRRVPVPVVRPPLEWFDPTGVRLERGSRVVILPDTGGVAEALSAALADRGVEVLNVDPTSDAPAVAALLEAWLAAGPIDGLYALAALDLEPPLGDIDLDGWRQGLQVRVKRLAAASRALYESLDATDSFIVTATRNGGAHGYDERGAISVMAGAVSGFTKALARERPAALVKVLDVEAGSQPAEVASTLVDETLHDRGVVEIGRMSAVRLSIELDERAAPPADPAHALGPDSVVVATGAAGSIVSAVLADLARAAGGGTFHLLDLIPEPDAADPDLAMFASDRDGLKRELASRLVAKGERATPVLIERELAAIERRSAAQAGIDAIASAGGTVHWYAADLRDSRTMTDASAAIAAASDRIDLLLHAGGLEISRLLPDKSPDEFDLVFDVKVDGWFNLLHGLGHVPIGTALVFSSIAGRFGNGGQTDYSAANDLLCKSVSSFRSTRPETRGIAIDWTAWAGIGMASRGSIPKMMALAGIDMLPPETGIPVVRREITAAGSGGEVVVAGALGVMLDTPGSPPEPSPVAGAGPMVAQIAPAAGEDGIVVLTDLDPAVQPFLNHHRIEGTPVLPGVMGIEAFAEAARLLAPGWEVTAVEDVEFIAPFKWYRDQPRRLEVHVRAVPEGDDLVATCRLDGRRTLPGQPEQVTTHFTGRVVLSRIPGDLGVATPPARGAPVVTTDAIYKVFFHGPAYQVLAGVWRDGGATVGELATDLPEHHAPESGTLVAAPRLVELCFQTAGVSQLATEGSLGLPRRVHRLQVASAASESAARWAMTTVGDAGGVEAVVVDGEGRVLVRLSGYETVTVPGSLPPDRLAPLEAALR
jgi:malonyl CoA-acyl carrier protein transacylase/NADP-dependent 3-hydroxy acid dehydrogenase YdfG/acyl carrier protein